MQPGRNKDMLCRLAQTMPACCRASHLKSRGAIQLAGMDCLWKHISDIGDEFFQELTGFLQVCCIDNNLDKLENSKHMYESFDYSPQNEWLNMNLLVQEKQKA